MKLLAKTSLYYLLLSIPILVLSGFICYQMITSEVKDSNDELLTSRKLIIAKYLLENDSVALHLITKSKEAQINKISYQKIKNQPATSFSDTLILDHKEHELAVNRMITAIVLVKRDWYQIKIWRSTLEYDELLKGIFLSLILILGSLFLVSLGINYWISKTVWKPFYQTLHSLKTFRASDVSLPIFANTTVQEFTVLNKSLELMMDKMRVDYSIQKKFTENASHEIQTPLAIIKSKIELLIQSENLQEADIKLIFAIEDACSKLIRLNRSLLLLTKIENRFFKTTEKVSFESTVDSAIVFFEEHIKSHKIKIAKKSTYDFCALMNPDLCLVLINNLVQNAIRHNLCGGEIIILIENNKFTITNQGADEPLDSILFERFQKSTDSHQSLGLGLSIVQEIVDVSGLVLHYSYAFGKHSFTISLHHNYTST